MKRSDWFLLGLILVSFIPSIIFYPKLPDQIPMHWNLSGEVDRYGDKLYGAFFSQGVNLFVFFLLLITPKIDPRKENYQKFQKAYTIFRWAFAITFIIISQLTLVYTLIDMENLPSYLDISFIIPILVSALLIVIGNYLGKIQHNYFVGIRTPWTLNSEKVWHKTHRLAGKLFVFTGISGIIGSFFAPIVTFAMLIGPVIITVVVTTLYSYLQFRKES